MKALVQRVSRAEVRVGEDCVGAIGPGLLVLVAAVHGDHEALATRLAGRIVRLRVFEDAAGRMNRSLRDVGGAALVVSQFTLAADTGAGHRPSFTGAAPPDQARRLVTVLADAIAAEGVPVEQGRFGARMAVESVNDGPVTLWLEVAPTPPG